MKKKFVLLILALPVIISGCVKHHNYIYSHDKKQCITIISSKGIRFIIEGKHSSVPDTNYIKLNIVQSGLGDEIVGCWKNETEKYSWKIINSEAQILENKLDTMRFKFVTEFPLDSTGIPTIADFTKIGCFHLGMEDGVIERSKGSVILH